MNEWVRKLPAPRDALFLVLALLVVGLAGYSAGRFTAPREVEEKLEWAQLEQRSEKTKTKKKRTSIITVTPIAVATPDGGFVIAPMTVSKESEESETASKIEALNKAIGRSSIVTTNQPSWSIAAMGGARFAPTGVTGLVSVQGSRRIAGGVSAVLQAGLELDPKSPAPIVSGQVQGGVAIELP